jgi:hypothetical protein
MNITSRILGICSQLKWQLALSLFMALLFFILIKNGELSSVSLPDISKSDFLSFTSGLSTILALFCSVSFGFLLHHIQNSKAERLDALNQLVGELNRLKDLVYSTPESQETIVCERLISAYEDIESFDYPLIEYPEEHEQFGQCLSVDIIRNSRFLRCASSNVLNIENINKRIQVIAVKQISSRIVLYTLSKGVTLVGLLISIYLLALAWFTSENVIDFMSIQIFSTLMTIFIFIEFIKSMRRFMDEELEFVDFSPKT